MYVCTMLYRISITKEVACMLDLCACILFICISDLH